MKKAIFIAALLLAGGLITTFWACNKNRLDIKYERTPAFVSGAFESYDTILNNSGKLHNALLDALVISMDNYGAMDSTAYKSIMELYIAHVESIYGENNVLSSFKANTGYGQGITVINQIKADLENTPHLNLAYAAIKNLLGNATNKDQLKSGLLNIYFRYEPGCSPQYKVRLTNMLSVAYSSYQYWQNNYDGWADRAIMITMNKGEDDKKKKEEEERKKREMQAQKEQRIANLVQADLAGAAVGLGTAVGAVGVGAIASAVVALSWD